MTVILSISYALVYFLAFMHSFGPEKKDGDLATMWKGCVEKCSSKKK